MNQRGSHGRQDRTPEKILLKTPPNNTTAEVSIIAAILANEQILPIVKSRLSPDDFYNTVHGNLMQIAFELYAKGKSVNLLTIDAEREKRKVDLSFQELADIWDQNIVTTIRQLECFCDLVKETAQRRKLIRLYYNAALQSDSDDSELQTVVAETMDQTYSILDVKDERSISQELAIIVKQLEVGGQWGLKTGFPSLDSKVKGLQDGELYVLAGRPGMGKTALACKLIKNIVESGTGVFFMSLEMTMRQLLLRYLSLVGQVPYEFLRDSSVMGDAQIKKVFDAAGEIAGWNMVVDDTSGIPVSEITARIEAACRKVPEIGFVVVDHLHQIPTDGYGNGNAEAYGLITLAFKSMAKRLNLPVMLLSQLNRGVEMLKDKRPKLFHLRESGAIEQNADHVWFLYRESYYQQDYPADIQSAQIIIAKNKSLETGTVNIDFRANFMDFVEPEA